jgi:glucosamine--fructose-6-phosphate aminotransferase (isomerizing)
MNLQEERYSRFALVREMLETPQIIAQFDAAGARDAAPIVREANKLFLTGEGSSRIFPAKNLIYENLKRGGVWQIATDGARQAHEYDLRSFAVFAASNSGKTKEVISLFTKLAAEGHPRRLGLTANHGVKLEEVSTRCYHLNCGSENAVAATKSVVEQALFYRSILACLEGDESFASLQQEAARAAHAVLEMPTPRDLVDRIAQAPLVYFAGRNNGVAEELTLKTNEITRKKSDFLEGTYAVHGIEEVMDANEVMIVIDPFAAEAEKFQQTLGERVGLTIVAIAAEETIFPTIRIPYVPGYETILQLLAGWNLLVEVGVAMGIDLDKPVRARKIGNEYQAG